MIVSGDDGKPHDKPPSGKTYLDLGEVKALPQPPKDNPEGRPFLVRHEGGSGKYYHLWTNFRVATDSLEAASELAEPGLLFAATGQRPVVGLIHNPFRNLEASVWNGLNNDDTRHPGGTMDFVNYWLDVLFEEPKTLVDKHQFIGFVKVAGVLCMVSGTQTAHKIKKQKERTTTNGNGHATRLLPAVFSFLRHSHFRIKSKRAKSGTR